MRIIKDTINLCTIFDENYALQALSLIDSVKKNTDVTIFFHILPLTSKATEILDDFDLQNVNIYVFKDLITIDFDYIKNSRSWPEFCFAAGPLFFNFLAENLKEGEILGYIDADCYFYNDILSGLLTFNQKSQIQIHEHRYSKDRMEWEKKSGRFNVGLVIGQIGPELRSCLKLWSNQVFLDSSLNFEKGTCGDQKYLDEWPKLYSSLKINPNLGVGVGPWNLNNSIISMKNRIIYVDQQPLIFYHFHGLEIYYMTRYFCLWSPAPGYRLNSNQYYSIYSLYIKSLMRQIRISKSVSFFRNRRISIFTLLKNIILRNSHFTFIR